jgi:hypothetical protein
MRVLANPNGAKRRDFAVCAIADITGTRRVCQAAALFRNPGDSSPKIVGDQRQRRIVISAGRAVRRLLNVPDFAAL